MSEEVKKSEKVDVEAALGNAELMRCMPDSDKTQCLIEALEKAYEKNKLKKQTDDEDFYRVNLMTSAVALIYEKVRNFVDNNEDHLLRKNAIYRIVKRRFLERSKIAKLAENIIKELISAGYLPNNQIPESMRLSVGEVLSKYQLLFEEIQERHGLKAGVQNYQWLLNIAAVELEETLVPSNHEKVYTKFLLQEVKKRVHVIDPAVDESSAELYSYIAVHRSLVKSDRPMLNYLLLKLYYPAWKGDYESIIPDLAQSIEEVKEQVEAPIDHKVVRKLIKKVRRFAMMTRILEAVIESKDTDRARLSDIGYLEERVRAVTLKRYKEVKQKLSGAITRSIIYVFLTKMLLAFVIEAPIDYAIYGQIHYFSIFVNITFPSLVLILIAISIPTPGEKNTKSMIDGVFSMLSEEPVKVDYIKPPKKRSLVTKNLFRVIYVLAFLIPFYIIIRILLALNFSVISIILFLVFLSIVSFFGTRIRTTAKDMIVTPRKDTLLSELVEFFTTPILRFGKWLSLNFSKVNVFAFFMDFVIEAPLKLVLQVLEEWFGYVKEKKEDLY